MNADLIGAVQAAWDQACVLRSQDALEKWPDLSRRITAATAIHSADELHRGTVLLLGSALGQIGAGSPAGRRNAERFTSTLMTKVGQWAGTEAVERSDLPMVRQAVTVAFEGRDPVAWRDRAGPVPDSERRAMTCALALTADFVDLIDGPGSCERTLLASLGRTLD